MTVPVYTAGRCDAACPSVDVLPDGTLTRVVGPNAETDFTTLSGLSSWPQ